jgi:hypothetical protein
MSKDGARTIPRTSDDARVEHLEQHLGAVAHEARAAQQDVSIHAHQDDGAARGDGAGEEAIGLVVGRCEGEGAERERGGDRWREGRRRSRGRTPIPYHEPLQIYT